MPQLSFSFTNSQDPFATNALVDWSDASHAPVPPWEAHPPFLGWLGYTIMIRGTWDPSPLPRGRRPPTGIGALSTWRQIEHKYGLFDLMGELQLAFDAIAQAENWAAHGVTFNHICLVASGYRWTADVLSGGPVEQAFWELYRESVIELRVVQPGVLVARKK